MMMRLGGAAALAGLTLVVGAPAAQAHPLGNFTTNRSSALEVSTTQVTVHYRVDMAEIPTFQEKPRIDSDGDGEVAGDELDRYARAMGRRLVEEVTLTADGELVELTLGPSRASLAPGQGGLDVLRIAATFIGDLPSERVALAYEDRNFTDPERLGWKEVTAFAVDGQGIESSSVPSRSPSDGLRRYPRDLLSSPPDVTRAHLILAPEAGDGREAGSGAGTATTPRAGAPSSFAALIERPLSPVFFLAAVGLALGFGALHALGPGHGKTVMAAYLVGGRGRPQDALLVGVAVSLMHTASVVALGLATLAASNLFAPEAVYPWLSLAAGVVVLGLGAWLLWSRLGLVFPSGARRSHPGGHHHGAPAANHPLVHPHGHVHTHPHGNEHDAAHPDHAGLVPPHEGGRSSGGPDPLLSRRGLGAVALSGGLLPSPTALVVLLGAVALDRIAFGVVLVTAFSVGLAAALTAVGILVLKARDFASGRLGHRAGVLLPVLSAAAIVVVGLFLTARAVANLS